MQVCYLVCKDIILERITRNEAIQLHEIHLFDTGLVVKMKECRLWSSRQKATQKVASTGKNAACKDDKYNKV